MSLEVVPIHRYPQYLHDCCNIINQEWKRSESARLHSLNQSKDNLPTSLILLRDKIVIGHVKLSVIPSNKKACFLESLIIDKSFRGKGYGSTLMNEAENYCRNLGLTTVILSTKGQEEFYFKLGYIECAPVSIYGSLACKITGFIHKNKNEENLKHRFTQGTEPEPLLLSSGPPPPPPPIPKAATATSNKNGKIYMSKKL